MTPDVPGPLAPRPGANPSLAPAGSPLIARGLSDLTPSSRRVLIVADDRMEQWWNGHVVQRYGYEPVRHERTGRVSDALACLPFEAAIVSGHGTEYLAELRAILPDEIPVLYEMPGKDTAGEPSPLEYGNAVKAGAAFVFWPRTEEGPRIVEEVFPDAIVLAKFLRDRPEAALWPSGPPPDPAAYRILVVKDDIGALGPPREPLREMGFQVTFATDGAHGLQLFEAERPDVVWMNALRPEPSGPAALQQLCDRAKGHVPCLAYAGHGRGWLKRAGPVFRCWLFPGDQAYSRMIFHDAIRLRRAYQHSLTPRGQGGPTWPPGAAPFPPPPPLPP